MAQLKVTYKKSTIGYSHDQKQTVHSLGLRRLNQSVLLPDNSAVRGMLFKVRHLVAVEEVAGEPVQAAALAAGSPAAPRVDPIRRSRTYDTEQTS